VRKFIVNKMYLNEYQRLLQVQNSMEANLEKNIRDSFGACVIFCEKVLCGDVGFSGNSVDKTIGKKIARDCLQQRSWHSLQHFHCC
jgi:hypothetical protein